MTWHFVLRGVYLMLGLITLWSYWLAPDASSATFWQAIVYTIAPASAVVGGWLTVKEYGWQSTAGRIYFTITLGLTGWFIGEVLWTYFDLIAKVDPFPSIADWFYFFAYIPLGVGLIWQYKFLRQTIRTRLPYTLRILLTMVAILFSGIALYFGVFESIQPDYTVFENGVAMSYGVADIVLVLLGLVITIVTIEMRGGKFAGAWWWFLSGIFCTFVADIGFAMFTPEYESALGYYRPALDTLWIVGYIVMGYGLGRFGWLVRDLQLRMEKSAEQVPGSQSKLN